MAGTDAPTIETETWRDRFGSAAGRSCGRGETGRRRQADRKTDGREGGRRVGEKGPCFFFPPECGVNVLTFQMVVMDGPGRGAADGRAG